MFNYCKITHLLLLVLLAVFFSSCSTMHFSAQKRLYRQGYSIDWGFGKNNIDKNITNQSSKVFLNDNDFKLKDSIPSGNVFDSSLQLASNNSFLDIPMLKANKTFLDDRKPSLKKKKLAKVKKNHADKKPKIKKNTKLKKVLSNYGIPIEKNILMATVAVIIGTMLTPYSSLGALFYLIVMPILVLGAIFLSTYGLISAKKNQRNFEKPLHYRISMILGFITLMVALILLFTHFKFFLAAIAMIS